MEPVNENDDANWKLGVFYYNPNDSRFLVSKRFGWGWTLNFANIWSYVALVALLLVVFAFKYYLIKNQGRLY